MIRTITPHLTPEEEFLWRCAREWRDPPADLLVDGLDWPRVLAIGGSNRMQSLLHQILTTMNQSNRLPDEAQEALQQDAARFAQDAALMGDSLRDYLRRAAERGIETVIIKGLATSANLYGDPSMRPGADIDILVRRQDVEGSLEILEAMGIGQNWPNLMDDRFYARHHLHQQRCTPDLKLWYEIHWALDHPLTSLTIDYEAMMDRAGNGRLLAAPVQELSPPDNLIALCVHLVKHAVYLPAALHRPDLARIILADGMLMYFLDVAELVKLGQATLDWALLVALCRAYGTTEMVGAVLQVCSRLLDAPVPQWVIKVMPVTPPRRFRRLVMEKLVEYETAVHLGHAPNRFWHFLLVTNGAFILRPIRLLEVTGYLLPGRDYLRRRYRTDGWPTAVAHFLRALRQYTRVGVDTIYFAWERHRRLRRMKLSASLFNRLEVEA